MEDDVPRSRGVVLRFNGEKGFGFIKPDEGGDDLFVHHSDIIADGYRTLFAGQKVEFYVLLENDKTRAVDVTGPNRASIEKSHNGGGRGGGYGYGRNGSGRGGGYGYGSGGGGRYGGGGECYTCGEYGHMARDCDLQRGGGGGGRGRGGGVGGRGGPGFCFNCGGIGHMARDCTSARSNGGGLGSGCYTCGDHGHIARECPNGNTGRVLKSYDRNVGGGRAGGSCYNCGEPGHFAKDCPNKS